MNKSQLYAYLAEFSGDYYMVTWNGHTEPLHFIFHDGVYFETPIEVRRSPMTEDGLREYVHEQYLEEYWDSAFEEEKNRLIDGYLYDIDYPQCLPFLPSEIENIYPITEGEYLAAIVKEWNNVEQYSSFKKERENMELTGRIILDEETKQALKNKIRAEVLEDIKEDGLEYEEALAFIKNIDTVCKFKNIFLAGLSEFLPKVKTGNFHFDDEKTFNKLKMCLEILKM